MRESFVFHKDYIDDLPSQYKAEFTQYTVNYGLYGELPPLTGDMLESALWAKIRRRIDTEAEKYEAISNKRREAANKRYAKETPPAAKNANAEIAEEPKKVGAVKMKDWRASVRTWEQRHKSEGGNRKAGGMWGNENEIPDEITDLF